VTKIVIVKDKVNFPSFLSWPPVSLMYELKKMESYFLVSLLGPGPRLIKKRIYLAAASQSLRNTAVNEPQALFACNNFVCVKFVDLTTKQSPFWHFEQT